MKMAGLRKVFPIWALAGLWVTACAPAPSESLAPPDAVLRVVGPWDLGGLDPKVAGMFTRMQIIEPLMNADDAGRPLPGLAERWTVSEDGLEWRFFLRPDVRFHDGSLLTASHAAWVLERARTAPGALALAPVSAIGSEGDSVVIGLSQPFAGLPALLANFTTSIMGRSAYSPDGGDVVAVVGTGPYRMASFEPPLRMELVYFDGWRGPPPDVKAVHYESVARIETRTLMAQSRQADLVYQLDAPAMKRILSDPANRGVDVTMPRTLILNINAGAPGLNDIKVRQAISLAIDRLGIARGVMRDDDMAATQLFAPALPFWHRPDLSPLTYDPAKARALLEEAGWTAGPDGIAAKGSERLSFSLLTYPDRAELPVMAAAIQEQLRQVGIEIDVRIGNASDIPLSHRDGSLQLALSARSYAYVTEPTPTLLQDFGPAGGDWGATGWSSPLVSDALAALQRTADPERQRDLRGDVAAGIQAGLPVIPIVWYRERASVSGRIESGVSMDPLERSFRIGDILWRKPATARP
jgi:peptide/nickel transport system substrate-binding protein